MKYEITWAETIKEGTGAKGPWKLTKMTLKDEGGAMHEGITTFDEVAPGQSIEGNIVLDGNYKNFKKDNARKPNMDRVMEKKGAMISEAQDVKAKNIAAAQDRSAWMWAKNNASTLVAEMIKIEIHQPSYDDTNVLDRVIDLATKIYNSEPQEPF